MELYGRPHVPRRNTSPSVSFLNDATAREASTPFAPPSTSRNQETEPAWDVTGASQPSRASSAGGQSATLLFHQSRPPLVSGRPQSGGVRRPAPGAPPLSCGMMTKQRPSTARESSRTTSRLVPSAPVDRELLFSRRVSEHRPETELVDEQPATRGHAGTARDEDYVRQLKTDILYCHQALAQFQMAATTRSTRSHTHVKTVQSMRESRDPIATSDAALQAQLARYNFSSDATQLQSTKARLEDLLAQSLTQVMRRFLDIRDDRVDDCEASQSEHHEQQQRERDEWRDLRRPPGNTGTPLPFANGCGSDAASLYTSCLFGVLQRVETFRALIVGLHSEKTCLLKDVADARHTVERLREEVELFKDALAKAVAKRSRSDPRGHHTRRKITAQPPEENAMPTEADLQNAELDVAQELAHSRRLQAWERDREDLEATIHRMQSELDALTGQLTLSRSEAEQHARAASVVQAQLDEAFATSAREIQRRDQQERATQAALKDMTDRCRQLEHTHDRETQMLRSDKQELETRIRKLESDIHSQLNRLAQHASAAAELKRATERIETLTTQQNAADAKLGAAGKECSTLRSECEQLKALVTTLREELAAASTRADTVTRQLHESTAQFAAQESERRQTELKLTQAHAEIERHAAVIHHQANQLSLLETRLSNSVAIDDEQRQRQQQAEDTAWHQKVAALEHALAVERQHVQSLKDDHERIIHRERERAEHVVSQATAVALELETAHLCLAERKTQREKELQEFADQKAQFLDRIAHLMRVEETAKETIARLQQQQHAPARPETCTAAEKHELETRLQHLHEQLALAIAEKAREQREAETRLEQLRVEYDAKMVHLEETYRHSVDDQIEVYRGAAENALAAELECRQQLEVVSAERDVLVHKLQGELATPRGSALSEARVEFQRAKLRISALEEKLSKSDSARGKDADGKAALLVAREKKLVEDQKSLKKHRHELAIDKKQVRLDREAVDALRAQVEADRLRNQNEHKLLRQVVSVLVSRLGLQMELLGIIPPDMHARGTPPRKTTTDSSSSSSSMVEFLSTYQSEHGEQWREMQTKWQRVQHALDEVDGQLVHMRARLEELNLRPPATPQPRAKPAATSPFSDAVAAGKETVPVAEQLASAASKAEMTANASTSSSCEPADHQRDELVPRERPSRSMARDEEHETFAIALAKEMRAMQESYERKLADLQHELRTVQRLRMESAQRLRAELDEEKKRSQQIITQWTDRCASLEAQLDALQRAIAWTQDRQIELLEQYECATTETTRTQILRLVLAVVAEACGDERKRRDARDDDRKRKLLAYCGSSSVRVERDDKQRLV